MPSEETDIALLKQAVTHLVEWQRSQNGHIYDIDKKLATFEASLLKILGGVIVSVVLLFLDIVMHFVLKL